ncbi:hypothetical protein KJ966_02425 [bacterium]|nr:hypothetical protein [bacterium]
MTKPSEKLAELIKKAIEDCELTTSEYNAILAQADEDKVLDSDERVLLQQLQEMIANGTIERVPG